MDFGPPGCSVHGFFRQEYWSGLPNPHILLFIVLEMKKFFNVALLRDVKLKSLTALPTRANADITYTSSNESIFTLEKSATDERKVTITGVDDGTATLTATTGSGESAKTATISITVTAVSE